MSIIRHNPRVRSWFFASKERYALSKRLDYYLSAVRNRRVPDVPHYDVVVCGMLRSGSTLVYNILREVIFYKVRQHGGFYAMESDYLKIPSRDFIPTPWKTHDYSHLLVRRVSSGRSVGIFTHRNLLDSIASQVQKGWITDMDEFLASTKLRKYVFTAMLYDGHPDFHSIAYRELMTGKREVVKRLFCLINGTPDREAIDRIHRETEVGAMKSRIGALTYDRLDANLVNHQTGLHHNHINDPSIGKWKTVLGEAEVAKITATDAYRQFCDHFGYAPHPSP